MEYLNNLILYEFYNINFIYMSLCKYSNMFGKPNEDFHKYRLFNIAIVDVIATLLVAWVIQKISKLSFIKILLVLFIISIIAHHMFCVETTVDKLLFG